MLPSKKHLLKANASIMAELNDYRQMVADRDLILMPCRIGDKVSAKVVRPYNGHEFMIGGVVTDIKTMIRVMDDNRRPVDFFAEDIGQTVFIMSKQKDEPK